LAQVDHRDQGCGAVMPVAAVVDRFKHRTVRDVGRPGDRGGRPDGLITTDK
jgi:hypothetical protein